MNLSASWSSGQNLDSLVKAEDLLARLFDVLEQELQAVARFDIEVVTEHRNAGHGIEQAHADR